MKPLSALPKTWVFDLDGVLVVHKGHVAGGDVLLPGVKALMAAIGPDDRVVLLSARDDSFREASLAYLAEQGVRVDHAIFGLPMGERILLNDRKPSGLDMAIAVNLDRNAGLEDVIVSLDPTL